MHSREQGGAFVEGLRLQRLRPALGLASESVISHVLHLCPLRCPTNVGTINHILERNENRQWREANGGLDEGSVKVQ